MDPIESRRAARREINLKGSFKIKDDLKYKFHVYKEPIDLTVVDVGALGCGFVAAHYLPKGLIVQLRVKDFPVILDDNKRGRRDIEFTGRVMSCRTIPSRANRIGLEFVDIKGEEISLIKRYVESGD